MTELECPPPQHTQDMERKEEAGADQHEDWWSSNPISILTSTSEASRRASLLSPSLSSPQNVHLRPAQQQRTLKHLLVQATGPQVDLCKFLLSSATLSYPPTHLLSWNEIYAQPNRRAGGTHIAKIDRVLTYLDSLKEDEQEDLVLIADGYDMWFQLPATVLISRYYAILYAADAMLAERFGPLGVQAIQRDNLDSEIGSKIVFGSGKECTPNQEHTMACYMAPLSPVSEKLYGKNSDTVIGHDQYHSQKQQYLDSGYIMGPAGAIKKVFRRAQEYVAVMEARIQTGLIDEPTDNGSGTSAYIYHGSSQSVFAHVWGRQEYIRETLRRRFDPSAGGPTDIYKQRSQNGTFIEDVLDPVFVHEEWDSEDDLQSQEPFHLLKHHDFGITLDYYSTIGHQKRHSERDATWITHQDPESTRRESASKRASRIAGQIESAFGPASEFDCTHNIPASPPRDVLSSRLPTTTRYTSTNASMVKDAKPESWLTTPLYTHLCLSTTPVLVHHNSPNPALNSSITPVAYKKQAWHNMSWLYAVARPLVLGPSIYEANGFPSPETQFDTNDAAMEGPGFAGATTDKGYSLSFNQLCRPMAMLLEEEIFGPGGTFKKVDVGEEMRKAKAKAAKMGLSVDGELI